MTSTIAPGAERSAPAATPSSCSISEAAHRTGLSTDTLRYYERDGLLLQPVHRTSSGHRRYDADDLRWIELIGCLRATGMPIRDVRRYATLVRAGDATQPERLHLLLDHREQVLAQLAEVSAHLSAIEAKITLYQRRTAA